MLRLVHSGLSAFDRATINFRQATDRRDVEAMGMHLKEMNSLARKKRDRKALVPIVNPGFMWRRSR